MSQKAERLAEDNIKEAAENLRQFNRDLAFFASRRDALLAENEGKWVAIYREKEYLGDTLDQLIQGMEQADVPRAHAVIDHLVLAAIAAY